MSLLQSGFKVGQKAQESFLHRFGLLILYACIHAPRVVSCGVSASMCRKIAKGIPSVCCLTLLFAPHPLKAARDGRLQLIYNFAMDFNKLAAMRKSTNLPLGFPDPKKADTFQPFAIAAPFYPLRDEAANPSKSQPAHKGPSSVKPPFLCGIDSTFAALILGGCIIGRLLFCLCLYSWDRWNEYWWWHGGRTRWLACLSKKKGGKDGKSHN